MHQARLDEVEEQVDGRVGGFVEHAGRGVDAERSWEDAEPGEGAGSRRVEEPPAPVEGAAQGGLPGRAVDRAAGQVEGVVEALEHGPGAEQPAARRDQLDRQGQSVQPVAHRPDRPLVLEVGDVARTLTAGVLHVEVDGRRQAQRTQGHELLAQEAQG